jgi:hypothetical protein
LKVNFTYIYLEPREEKRKKPENSAIEILRERVSEGGEKRREVWKVNKYVVH